MLNFSFTADKNTILIELLTRTRIADDLKKDTKQILKLQKYVAKNFPKEYSWIKYKSFYLINEHDFFEKMSPVYQSSILNTLYNEAAEKEYDLRNLWDNYQGIINNILINKFKISIPSETNIDVRVTSPRQQTGQHIMENTVMWSCNNKDNGISDIIFLTHESLHVILPYEKYAKDDPSKEKENILHAIIELCTDNELYSILTDQSHYNNIPKDEYRAKLQGIKAILYPYFQVFISKNHEELASNLKRDNVAALTSLDNIGISEDDLRKINMDQFINFAFKVIKDKNRTDNNVTDNKTF
jgi:hypothetical protein